MGVADWRWVEMGLYTTVDLWILKERCNHRIWKMRKEECSPDLLEGGGRCCRHSLLLPVAAGDGIVVRSNLLAHRIEECERDACHGRHSRSPALKMMEKGGELVVAAIGSG
ncbi:hypothetical protein ACLOJK_012331 [Asimina triloba]